MTWITKHKKHILVLLLAAILVLPTQGFTVYNSIYKPTLKAGQVNSFTMGLKADVAHETGKALTIGMDNGNCSQWVTLDKSNMILSYNVTKVTATIRIPNNTPTGFYKCAVQYTMAPSGWITFRIEVPIKITVVG